MSDSSDAEAASTLASNTDAPFSSQTLALRMQKKLLSKMSTKSVASMFVDEKTGQLLDALHSIARLRCNTRKEADKILRHLIKVVVKVGLLLRQGQGQQLTAAELAASQDFSKKFRTAMMTVVSFHEVAFSLDPPYLSSFLQGCHDQIKILTQYHMTEKNRTKLANVFAFFSSEELITAVFSEEQYEGLREKVVGLLNELVENGVI